MARIRFFLIQGRDPSPARKPARVRKVEGRKTGWKTGRSALTSGIGAHFERARPEVLVPVMYSFVRRSSPFVSAGPNVWPAKTDPFSISAVFICRVRDRRFAILHPPRLRGSDRRRTMPSFYRGCGPTSLRTTPVAKSRSLRDKTKCARRLHDTAHYAIVVPRISLKRPTTST